MAEVAPTRAGDEIDTADIGTADIDIDIDELARRAATTVRTVRMYQEKGLLPPPDRRGRRAAYGTEHLVRLRLVQRLADRGYSLAAIKDLTDAWEAQHGLGHVLGLEVAVAEPLSEVPPRRFTTDELTTLFPGDEDLSGLARALEIGMLVQDGEEFVAANPVMVEIGAELTSMGVPLHASLDVAARILSTTDALAEQFVAMFLEHIWTPFEQAGEPDEDMPAMVELIRRQRPLAVKAVASSIAAAVDLHVDRAIMMDAAPPGQAR
jgi:DNA-binding transcriptional MerR regulator